MASDSSFRLPDSGSIYNRDCDLENHHENRSSEKSKIVFGHSFNPTKGVISAIGRLIANIIQFCSKFFISRRQEQPPKLDRSVTSDRDKLENDKISITKVDGIAREKMNSEQEKEETQKQPELQPETGSLQRSQSSRLEPRSLPLRLQTPPLVPQQQTLEELKKTYGETHALYKQKWVDLKNDRNILEVMSNNANYQLSMEAINSGKIKKPSDVAKYKPSIHIQKLMQEVAKQKEKVQQLETETTDLFIKLDSLYQQINTADGKYELLKN